MLINYMTTYIESVKLSRDFVILQHFRLCSLFNKHVLDCFSTITCVIDLNLAIFILCQWLYRSSESNFQRGKPLQFCLQIRVVQRL